MSNTKNTVFHLPYQTPVVNNNGVLTPTWQTIFAHQIVPALQGLGNDGATGATGAQGIAGDVGPIGPAGSAAHWRMRRGL